MGPMCSGFEGKMDRREFLKTTAIASLYPFVHACGRDSLWDRDAFQKKPTSRVAILEAKSYRAPLKEILLRGIKLFPLQLRGKTVLLKPNLVEFEPDGVINTHPAVIAAAIEAFRTAGAKDVIVAEGPGHRRDNEYLLTASGLYSALKETGARYVDLNSDDLRRTKLRSQFTNLRELYLPETLFNVDLVVSMPKLKTHHWAGVTLSLKNMFGVIPGSVYGWPKNILHWSGIHGSILDINSTIPIPRFAIIDGIVGMEGDGPVRGTAKNSGVLVLGYDLAAVDATAARLMNIVPEKIEYLSQGGQFLGNIAEETIEQVGEKVSAFRQDFQVIESFRSIKALAG